MSSEIFIKIIGDSNAKLDRLNLRNSLSDIRKELEKYDTINETLSFFKKNDNEFAEVEHEIEDKFRLNDIVEYVDSACFLYLKKSSRLGWKILNEKCKLDYGRTMSFDGIKKANNRAFKMKDCELTYIGVEGHKKDKLEFESEEDWIKK